MFAGLRGGEGGVHESVGGVQRQVHPDEPGPFRRRPGTPDPHPQGHPHGPGPRPLGRGGGIRQTVPVPAGRFHRRCEKNINKPGTAQVGAISKAQK